MADPTLKDVLAAIVQLRGDVGKLDTRMDKVEAKVTSVEAKVTSVEAKVTSVEAKVDAHRAETAEGFTELDRELTGHAEVHRELEKDVEALKRRPPRTAARAPRRR